MEKLTTACFLKLTALGKYVRIDLVKFIFFLMIFCIYFFIRINTVCLSIWSQFYGIICLRAFPRQVLFCLFNRAIEAIDMKRYSGVGSLAFQIASLQREIF